MNPGTGGYRGRVRARQLAQSVWSRLCSGVPEVLVERTDRRTRCTLLQAPRSEAVHATLQSRAHSQDRVHAAEPKGIG